MPDGGWRPVIGAARAVEGGLADRNFVTDGADLVHATLTQVLLDRTEAGGHDSRPT